MALKLKPNVSIKFKPDSRLRNKFFTPDSFSHPAKMHCGLFLEILARLELPPGAWLLDPMSGTGTALLACQQGINVVALEMETHFLEPMPASWAKMQTVGPMLGYSMGQALILRGDARMLPIASADAVVTSPPYEGIVNDGKEGPGVGANEERYGRWAKGTAKQNSYTQVDAVVTSPPFMDIEPFQCKGFALRNRPVAESRPSATAYSDKDSTNIGNLRGQKYWSEISKVYAECHRVLIPGGIMALVVRGYTRDKKYVDLPGQTADLISTLGFEVFDRWTREVPLSFWRTLQKNRGNWDEALRFEHVIAGRKL